MIRLDAGSAKPVKCRHFERPEFQTANFGRTEGMGDSGNEGFAPEFWNFGFSGFWHFGLPQFR
jgi:hypothetical protein